MEERRCALQQKDCALTSQMDHSRHSHHPGLSGSPHERTFGQCPRLQIHGLILASGRLLAGGDGGRRLPKHPPLIDLIG
jgi:hypothetical protein